MHAQDFSVHRFLDPVPDASRYAGFSWLLGLSSSMLTRSYTNVIARCRAA
jgi:hypothetical protein